METIPCTLIRHHTELSLCINPVIPADTNATIPETINISIHIMAIAIESISTTSYFATNPKFI